MGFSREEMIAQGYVEVEPEGWRKPDAICTCGTPADHGPSCPARLRDRTIMFPLATPSERRLAELPPVIHPGDRYHGLAPEDGN